MSRGPDVRATLVWLAIPFLILVMLTIAVFLTFSSPESRDKFFYLWLIVACTAEYVFFAWAANRLLRRHMGRSVSGATQLTIYVMIVIWLALILGATFLMAQDAVPANRYSDKIALACAILTFLFLAGAIMLYAQDMRISGETARTMSARADLRIRTRDINFACDALRDAQSKNPDHAVDLDRLVKRLDAARTAMDYAPPSKLETAEDDGASQVYDVNRRIIAEVSMLRQSAERLRDGARNVKKEIENVRSEIDNIESMLRERQQILLS